MFGDTLTVTLDGSGGTARVCSKINQDAYSSEYLNRISTDEIRVRIRHSKEAAKAGQSYPMERHNVEFTQTVFATPTAEEKVRQIYVVIRNRADDALVDVTNLAEALPFWLTDANLDKLNIWEV
jgi:hypothetical protein